MKSEIESGTSSGRLLLIDADSFVRRMFRLTFEELGFGVATATCPAEGIRMVAEETFDIVIVEASFSESQEREIEHDLRRLEPGQRPIFLGYEPRTAERVSDSGGTSLSISRRKRLTPLVTQIRDLLSIGAGATA